MKNPTTITRRPLPGILASAIATIRWPLEAAHHPPLYLKAVPDLPTGDDRIGCRLDSTHPLAAPQLPDTLDELFHKNCDDNDRRAFGTIATALVLLGHGHADEAHSLVTPYSWSEAVLQSRSRAVFGHRSSRAYVRRVYAQSRASVRSLSYGRIWHARVAECQLLVQRGGFTAGGSGAGRIAARRFVSLHKSSCARLQDKCSKAETWALDHQIRTDSKYYFESRAVHELCAKAMKLASVQEDNNFCSFAERVAETELRVLLAHSLERAGFANDSCSVDAVLANRM